jgi:hypothetical protein
MGKQGSERRADFLEDEEMESKRRERNRRQVIPEDENPRGGRGSRYRQPVKTEIDDVSEENFEFEPVDDVPDNRTRSRRREQNEVPQEEWSEVDAVLQGETGQRGGRRQRFDKRQRPPKHEEKPKFNEDIAEEDSGMMTAHQNIPSWDDAVGDLISGNVARHKNSPRQGNSPHQGKGRR